MSRNLPGRVVHNAHRMLRCETIGIVANHRLLSNQDGNTSRSDTAVKNSFHGDLRPNAGDIAQGDSNSGFFDGHGFL